MLNTINYDEIDEQYGITPVIKEAKSINNLALSNVQTVPDELEQEYNEVYSAPEWFENLNVCSEDEIKEWQAMGPMGIAEAWERNNKWASFVPYVNTTKDAAEAVNVSVLLKRLKDGKDLTEKQTDVLVDYLRDVKEQQVRGYSFAGGVVDAALTAIPYIGEFGIGLWASGAGGIGLAPLSKTLTTIGAKKAAKKAVQKAMQEATMKSTMTGVKKNLTKQEIKKIYDDAIIKTSTAKALGEVGGKRFATETAKALPKALTSSAKLSLTKMPQNFVGNIADRQISQGIYITDAGQGVFTNSENLALSTMKALGDSTFEALTETSGFLFTPISRYFAKPIRNVLPKKFYTAFDKLVSTRYGMKTTEVLKKYGYDGILEEMGEEQLNRFLTDVFGSNGVQGYTLDGFLNNVFYFDREGKKGVEGLKTGLKNAAKGYATEALSFALAGAGARGAVGSVSKISDKWNQKKLNDQYKKLANYSLNEFYLDQGFIKIKGSQSSAELALRHRAEAMGIDKSTIDEYCQLSSENEIRAKLQELILNENATIDTEKTKVEKQAVEELKNTYFNQLKNTGVDEVVANQTADLYAYSFAKLAKDNGISIKDIPEANIDFRKLTPEQAIEQVKQGFKDNTQVKFQQQELPKYIEEEYEEEYTEGYVEPHYEADRELTKNEKKYLDLIKTKFVDNNKEKAIELFRKYNFNNGGYNRIVETYNNLKNGNITGKLLPNGSWEYSGKYFTNFQKKIIKDYVAGMSFEEIVNKYIQSPAQFYLDQGLIKINGSQSLAEQKLREVWSEQNIDKDLQDSVLKNMSETEIRSELKKATENKVKNQAPEEATKRIEHDLTKKFMDNKTFAKEKDAKTVAALFSAPLQKLSETTGISLEELMQEEMPEIQREAEKAAKDNGRYIQTDGRIEEIFNELNNLPDDFADEEYCQQLLDEADILSKIRDGNLEEADFSKAKSLIRILDYAGYTEFADELRELSYNQTGQLFQSENLEKNLIDNFGMSEKDITDNIKADVENLLNEYNIAPEEFTLEDIRLYGSYSKGANKNGSDLDFVVLYSGNMSEDSAFNILNETKLTITDKDGNEIEVDINPINKAERESIDDYLSDIEKLEPKKLFQAVDTAGVGNSAEISVAKKEWEEKGTESKYFKKWFGDSKVVDESGEPLVVYHGTEYDFDEFEASNASTDYDFPSGMYFSSSRNIAKTYTSPKPDIVMPLYLKIENPLVLDANGRNYNDFYDELYSVVRGMNKDVYDGIIINNIRDNWSQNDDGGEVATTYVTFNPEQIKSVDNQGTFDESNPNIYYQGGSNYQEQLEDVKNNLEYKKFVNKVFYNKLPKKEQSNLFVIGKTPDKLIEAGIPQNNLSIGVGVINKAKNNKNSDHNLSENVISNVYTALKNPIAVIETLPDENEKDKNKKYAVILDLQADNGDFVMVSIKINQENKGSIINEIKTIHSRKNYEPIIDKALNDKKLLKVDAEKIKDLLNSKIHTELISDGAASLIERIAQQKNDVKFYQGATENDKNLLMTHAMKSYRLDDVIESGGLIAPSFAITKKDMQGDALDKFGDILFIRNPKKIDFQNDNIYDRDIYSPRIPQPWYDIPNGRTVDGYEYESLKRNYESNPEKFVEKWGETFDEMFKGAKKILNLGFTPSGNRKFVPYTNENILKEMKKQGLVNKEGFDYGLSSLLSRFSTQKKDLKSLKESAKSELGSKENLDEKYEQIKNEYEELGEKLAPLYWDKYSFYEFQSDVFYAIAKNKKKYLKDTYNIEVPAELEKEVKEFVEKAKSLPRSYFEAKPMREVDLSEFSYAIAEKGIISEKQKKALEDKGIKVVEYNHGEKESVIKELQTKAPEVFFQNDYDSNIADTEKGIMNAKGFFYEKTLFDGTLKDNIMVLIDKKADASTLIHEFGHIYLQALNRLAKTSPRAKEQLLTVNKWLRFDGNEYTEAQHEKFANGFIAYVKSGKAPSYGLKRVFENFRRWLSDIYNNFITSETVELDEETQKVFDELLGDLSVNQLEKLSEEIIQKAKDNALLRMRDEDVEKGKVKFNELTDEQRRYRDTAYEIVYYALKHSKNEETRNYVQNISDLRMKLGNKKTKSLQRQFERLELLLAETEDAFSANDGFLPEWGEFFTDPGVSYDNSESGADAELALEALSVITDKKYLTDETYEELSDEDVRRAEYEFEYIINEYRNAKDKSIPMAAFYEWLEKVVHPYLEDMYAEKWENQTNEIDRYQAMSKFEQAKEDLKLKAAQMQGLGDYSWQFAEYAREIIKRLDFMTEKDKVKIFDKLKDFNSFKDIKHNLDDVMDFAQTLYNVTERRKIADDIIKEVDRTIHEWKDGIKRTKYTYPANKLFTRLRELNRLPLEYIKDLYDAQVNEEIKPTYEADAVHDEDYYETIEKMFIEFKANGVYYNSTAFLQDLLNRIQTAKYTAKVARDEIDFERKMQAVNLIDEAAKAVTAHTGKVSKLEKAYRYAFNLDSALEMMFNKSIKQKFSLDYLYAQKDAKVGADRDEVLKKLKENFGYKGAISDTLLFNRFIDMTKKEFDIYQRYTPDIEQGVIRDTHRDKKTGKTVTDKTHKHNLDLSQWAPEKIKLSRMEVLYYYIQSLNDESYKILTDAEKGQFDRFEFDSMINKLTEQEKMMGIILQQAAEKYYDDLNRYHIRKYHTELGKVKNYFPRKTEMTEVKPLELFSDYVNYSGVISAQKQRTAYKGARIAPANPVAVLFDHIEKANTLIIMGEQLDLMNRVFKEQNLKKKIEAVWGIDTAREFYNQIAGNLYSGQASMISEAEREIGRWENNVIKAQIFAKAQVGLKQIISFMNYGTGDEYVSTKEWTEEFFKQSLNVKEWKKSVDYMMNIPYLKDRFGRGGSTDALKRQLEQKMFAKISLLDDFFSLPIKVGDVGAIVMGGKPYIDILLKKGYTEEQALKIFIEKTVNEMQSSIPSTLSNMQRNATKNPLAKMIFAYQNTPWQYFRVACNSIIRWKQNPNKYTGLNMVKLVGLYMYVFPLIFNLASSLSPITGDEEELKSDLWKSALGGFTFVPYAYQIVNAMLSGVLGERVSSGTWFDTTAVHAGNLTRKVSKGEEITALDVIKTISLFGEAATGLPLVSLETEATGVADIATGKPVKGFAKVAGYSDYRSRKIAGEEE